MPDVLQDDLKFFCIRLMKANGEKKKIIGQAITEVYKRLVKKQIQRRIRSNLTKKAEIEALDVFADNLRQLLMTPACKNAVILGTRTRSFQVFRYAAFWPPCSELEKIL